MAVSIINVVFSRNEGFILPDEMSVMFTNSSGNTSLQDLAVELKKQIERKHVHHLKKYGELTANTLERKHAPETPSTIKQSTLLKTVYQKSIDKAVVKYVVQGLQPFAVVE